MTAELYEKEYIKFKDIDSIPIIVNISKKQFLFALQKGIFMKFWQ